jgi:NDP-sugar pyrophosphorylase family protein
MINITGFIDKFYETINILNKEPWEITNITTEIIYSLISKLDNNYLITNQNIAVHKTAIVEQNVILKPPVILCENCFIGSNTCLRSGVLLKDNVKIGMGCEIKSSMIFSNSALAYFNFIGNSLIGHNVNFEAGSVTANHYNERTDKTISVSYNSEIINTNTNKFGSLVGDNSKIGANAVLSPGAILYRNSIVKRLELIEQIK